MAQPAMTQQAVLKELETRMQQAIDALAREFGAVRIRFAPGDAPLAIEAVRRDEPRWWRAGNGR